MPKSVKGFTLVEALISIVIISIISSLSIANYSDIRTLTQLSRDVDLLIGAVRTAQAEALAPDRRNLSIAEDDLLCRIRLEVDVPERTIIYRPVISTSSCDAPSSFTLGPEYRREEFEPGVNVSSQDSATNLSVDLVIPFGQLEFVGVGSANSQSFTLSRGNSFQTVVIYESGIIERL